MRERSEGGSDEAPGVASAVFALGESGSRYEGEFKWSGQGTLTSKMAHGQGVCTWSGGRKYVGEWLENTQHGRGRYTWADGSTYHGEWENSQMHGHGVYTWANGTKYEGMYARGKHLPGKGEYTWRTPFVSPSRLTELNKKKNMKAANRPSSAMPPARRQEITKSDCKAPLESPAKTAHPSLRTVVKSAVITNMLAHRSAIAQSLKPKKPAIVETIDMGSYREVTKIRCYKESTEAKQRREEAEALQLRITVMFNASLDAQKVMQIADEALCSHDLAKDFCKEHNLPRRTVGRVLRLVETTRKNMSQVGVGVHLLAVVMRRVRHGIRMQKMWSRDAMASMRDASRKKKKEEEEEEEEEKRNSAAASTATARARAPRGISRTKSTLAPTAGRTQEQTRRTLVRHQTQAR